MEFASLPDFPAFRDIQRALWGLSEVRGAALMVGAGLSRLAVPAAADAKPLPLWSNFQARMAAELYGPDIASAPADPLRLAEEYKAALGYSSLENLIREMVPDLAWNPGDLHRNLVALPWSDILTTNWDTLLERASGSDPDRRYEPVLAPRDIARTRSPRIVKLHGSLPATPPFIFTQEDYRTYPRDFAPFVNLAQQVLLENELCLLGFSGNDPNFLQWIGWVRDQLGKSARPIRLVGVLDLAPAQRAFLTGQNITPIDLAPLVTEYSGADRHRQAMEMFVRELHAGRPAPRGEWTRNRYRPTTEKHATLDELLEDIKTDRTTYPGWLVAPWIDRYRLRYETDQVADKARPFLKDATAAQKTRLAYELAWRIECYGWVVTDGIAELCAEAVEGANAALSRASRHELCISLAKAARVHFDDEKRRHFLELAAGLALSSDERAAEAYERALWHRDNLDYAALEAELPDIWGDDPIWLARKAALHAAVMQDTEAARLIRECMIEIRNRRAQDPRSVWLLSREAWAHFLWREARSELRRLGGSAARLEAAEDWPLRYTIIRSDPWDELRSFDRSLDDSLENRAKQVRRDLPSFDAGSWRRQGIGRQFVNGTQVPPWYALNHIIDNVGLARLRHIDVVERRLERAAGLIEERSFRDWIALIAATRHHEEGLIDIAFGRIAIARLDQTLVKPLFDRIKRVIDHGRRRLWMDERLDSGEPRSSSWVEEIRVHIEIISRLVVRLDCDDAMAAFRWACEVGRDPDFSHWWLYEPLDHLLERCFDAVPPSRRAELALDIHSLPILGHEGAGIQRYWPAFANSLGELGEVKREGAGWEKAIAQAIEAIKSSETERRTRGILRLLPLYRRGFLRPGEVEGFSEALWEARSAPGALPSNTNIIANLFLEGPPPPEGSAKDAFVTDVVERLATSTLGESDLVALSQAADDKLLLPDKAAMILQEILKWFPREIDEEFGHDQRSERSALGRALANAVLPALREVDIKPATRKALIDLADPLRLPEAMEALPEIAMRDAQLRPGIIQRITLALASTQSEIVNSAINAVIRWSRLAEALETAIPSDLATELANCCLARRPQSLYGALHAAVQLSRAGHLSPDDEEKLLAALDLLSVETAYENVDTNDPMVVTLTLIRKEGVRLAQSLREKGATAATLVYWLGLTTSDPLPEVRYALQLDW